MPVDEGDEDAGHKQDTIAHAWNNMIDSWAERFPARMATIVEAVEDEEAAAEKLISLGRRKRTVSHEKKSKSLRKPSETRKRTVGFR